MKLQMANQLLRAGRLDQATALCRQVLTAEPDNVGALRIMASIATRQDRYDDAITLTQRVIRQQPDDPAAHIELARLHNAIGQFDQARSSFRHALELQPGHATALMGLAMITRYDSHNDEVRAMEMLYADTRLPDTDRRRLAFALGKIFDDLGEYDRAFRFFEDGNRLARTEHEYSARAEAQAVQQVIECFGTNFVHRYQNSASEDDSLIVISGTPRTGTTLVEQILASHPQVHGTGETYTLQTAVTQLERSLNSPFPVGFDSLDPTRYRASIDWYLRELKALAGEHTRMTDKSISTIVYLGLIATMLPNAKIVHCQRDPRDQGLSIFQKDFGPYQPFSYDLRDIGRRHRVYADLLKHWQSCFPGRILVMQYEELIADMRNMVRSLLDHCELSFDPACLEFHNTARTVRTASLTQVRQPIYTSSVGRWKNYERQLQPLIEALGMTGCGQSEQLQERP